MRSIARVNDGPRRSVHSSPRSAARLLSSPLTTVTRLPINCPCVYILSESERTVFARLMASSLDGKLGYVEVVETLESGA